jgi:uncharacterized membrane-anchored protein
MTPQDSRHLIALGISSALVFAVFNLQILAKERLREDGRSVLLELAPVDPRSLMQGDYMILNYAISDQARGAAYDEAGDGALPEEVPFVARLDADGVATFSRLGHTPPPGPDEVLMTARSVERGWGVGAESFFFQEGQADVFADAKYGEVRISESGALLLVGLRGADKKPLGPPRW